MFLAESDIATLTGACVVALGSVRSGLFTTDDELAHALQEAGDLVQPMQAGLLRGDAVLGDLTSLVRNEHGGRNEAREITLFKSVGTALADLAAAGLVWSRLSPAQG